MISKSVVEVSRRAESGKNASRRTRVEGKIPGILYGMARPSFSVTVDPRNIEQILLAKTGRNTIFNLQLSGKDENKNRAVMLRDLQRDPVTGKLLHVDFVRIDMEATVSVNVPIHLLGDAVGVEIEDGVIDFIQRSVHIECLPNDIPDFLELDISETHVGQNLAISDLKFVENVNIIDDESTTLLTISVKRAEEVEVEEGEEGDEAETAEDAGEEGKTEGEEGGESA